LFLLNFQGFIAYIFQAHCRFGDGNGVTHRAVGIDRGILILSAFQQPFSHSCPTRQKGKVRYPSGRIGPPAGFLHYSAPAFCAHHAPPRCGRTCTPARGGNNGRIRCSLLGSTPTHLRGPGGLDSLWKKQPRWHPQRAVICG
jgi:hypothetical protein